MTTTNDTTNKAIMAETAEQKAARKAGKKKEKSAKKLLKLERILKGAGTDKPLHITDLNHLELAKALNDLQDGIDRIRKILVAQGK